MLAGRYNLIRNTSGSTGYRIPSSEFLPTQIDQRGSPRKDETGGPRNGDDGQGRLGFDIGAFEQGAFESEFLTVTGANGSSTSRNLYVDWVQLVRQ